MSKEAVKVEETMEIPVEELAEKPYTLRELSDEDIFPLIEIIGKVLPEDAKQALVQELSGEDGKEKSLKEVGVMIVFDFGKYIMKNFSSVKTEMYEFLSSMSGIPEDKLRKMPFGTTPKMVKEIFMDAKNTDFFKELSEFLS